MPAPTAFVERGQAFFCGDCPVVRGNRLNLFQECSNIVLHGSNQLEPRSIQIKGRPIRIHDRLMLLSGV